MKSLTLFLALIALLCLALVRLGNPSSSGDGEPLTLYCAAGIRHAVEPAVRAFEEETGTTVHIQFGGSGSLLGQLQVDGGAADLYLPGDQSFLEMGRAKDLIAEILPLATMRPVLAVAEGNPLGLRTMEDLLDRDLPFALGSPSAAAVGRVVKTVYSELGLWTQIEAQAKVFQPTVTELATSLQIGQVDAAIVWDATVAQFDGLDLVRLPELERQPIRVSVGVLRQSPRPTSALQLARFLQARDRGRAYFLASGLTPTEGDVWSARPEVLLYAGSMFHSALEETLHSWAQREGVDLTRVYNGCGILVSQMESGGSPDVFFSCDASFLDEVQERFDPRVLLSNNPLVLICAPKNPLQLKGLADLARPGLRVGLAHPKQSALGRLTQAQMEKENLAAPFAASGNLKQDAPQGDFLVNALLTGALDAAVVYASNAALAGDKLSSVALTPNAIAEQLFAVRRNNTQGYLLQRMFDAATSDASKEQFSKLGFEWRVGEGPR